MTYPGSELCIVGNFHSKVLGYEIAQISNPGQSRNGSNHVPGGNPQNLVFIWGNPYMEHPHLFADPSIFTISDNLITKLGNTQR
jgi:hypothetical protein